MSDFRVVLHVGPQKTGSTYLQTNFTALSGALAERGVRYVRALDPHGPPRSHRSEMASWLTRASDDEVAAYFRQARDSGAACLLVSDESLSMLAPVQIKRLARGLRDIPTEVVFFFRRWSDQLPSRWNERVKEGEARPLNEWISAVLAEPRRPVSCNDVTFWSAWASAFSRDAVKLVSYDGVRVNGGDIWQDFLATWLGIMDLKHPNNRLVNASYSALELEALRALSAVANTTGVRITSPARKLWAHLLREDGGEPFASLAGEPGHTVWIDDLADGLATHRACLDEWRDCFVLPAGQGDMLIPARRGVAVYDPAWVAGRDAGLALAVAVRRAARFSLAKKAATGGLAAGG